MMLIILVAAQANFKKVLKKLLPIDDTDFGK